METIDLYTETKRLLMSSKESIPKMAKNAGVNKHWLAKFKQGKYPNPGVLHVQRLHDYLAASTEEAA